MKIYTFTRCVFVLVSDSVGGNYFKQLEKTLLFIGSILVLVWLIAFYATHVISTNTQATNLKSSANDAITSDMNSVYNINSIKAISRSAWNAEPPVHELDKLELPNHFVIIAHTVIILIFFPIKSYTILYEFYFHLHSYLTLFFIVCFVQSRPP